MSGDAAHTLWIERYRPKEFSEVHGQQHIMKRLEAFVKSKNIPHCIFSGPAGVAKTTSALIIARKLYGEEWKRNFLELNSSDQRGIDTVRSIIKDFCRTKAMGTDLPKIIFLDEADALTKDAQHSLRRMMEQYAGTSRFILSCVTPDTKILLPQDLEIDIEQFFKFYEQRKINKIRNFQLNNANSKNDTVLAAVKLPVHHLQKKVLKITTMSGRKIKATDDHQLLTSQGWIKAGKLKETDRLIIYPHLEGTSYEERNEKIINEENFIAFINQTEEDDGFTTIDKTTKYANLTTLEKKKIIRRIDELNEFIKTNKGLTKLEFQIWQIIHQTDTIARRDIQKKIGLSRIRLVQLLRSIEEKGYISRTVIKKDHFFSITNEKPKILRNSQHVRNTIKEEYDLDISFNAVRRIHKTGPKGRVDRVLYKLKEKDLLNINYNDLDRLGALSRLCGVLLGDGHIVSNDIRLYFSGNIEALQEIKKDLDILGYTNHSTIKTAILENTIRGREFVGESTGFYLDSRSLSFLFQYLGIPKGDKVITPYDVPTFIKNGTKFVKREFLRGLFGSDASKPRWKNKNHEALRLRQNKATELESSMVAHYQTLGELLREFDVTSYIKVRDKGEARRKDGKKVLCFELNITPNMENLFRFLSRVGYSHEKYKIELACLSSEYLRHKLFTIKLMEEKAKIILTEITPLTIKTALAKKHGVSIDFIANRLKGKPVHSKRDFPSFEEWTKQYKYANNLVKNDIHSIEELYDEPYVIDITCHQDHNFVANGLVSHNCNYSSKLIDPIQSRCAIFRFRPLERGDIKNILLNVAKHETLDIDADALESIIDVSEGDARRAENILQSCASLGKHITKKNVFEVASAAEPKEVMDVLMHALNKDFTKARSRLLDIMTNHGLSGIDIIKQIHKEIWNLPLTDREKVKLIEKCGETEFRIVEGSDEYLQLENFLAFLTVAKEA